MTAKMAAKPWASSPKSQPSVITDRIPLNRYVTGLSVTIACSQPLIASLGTLPVVRNAKGKKIRNAEFTAAGFAVLSAMA